MNGIDLYDGITLHQGDCRDIMREYPDQHFEAVITDPPYGISFAGEKWDTATPHGFQTWAQSWGEEALRVIKPGGYLLAFSAPRTYHRLTSGLEDAGFEIRDENTRAVGCELDNRYIPLIKARFAQGIEAPLDLFTLGDDAA